MSKEDLIPIKTSERGRELGKIGGSKSTPEKKIAARLRELKKRGLSDANTRRIYEIMIDPDMSNMDILLFLESIRSTVNTPKEKVNIARLYMEFHKMRHGTKLNIQQNSTNININVDMADMVIAAYNQAKKDIINV